MLHFVIPSPECHEPVHQVYQPCMGDAPRSDNPNVNRQLGWTELRRCCVLLLAACLQRRQPGRASRPARRGAATTVPGPDTGPPASRGRSCGAYEERAETHPHGVLYVLFCRQAIVCELAGCTDFKAEEQFTEDTRDVSLTVIGRSARFQESSYQLRHALRRRRRDRCPLRCASAALQTVTSHALTNIESTPAPVPITTLGAGS